MATIEVREVNGITLPPAGKYEFDKAHTAIGFVARHMLTKVRGRFMAFDGSVQIGQRPEDSKVRVDVDLSSVTTGNEKRDDHLRSGDFFETEQHPTMTFSSTAVRVGEGEGFEIDGTLTVKDVTNPLTLQARFDGWGPGMQEGSTVAAFSATATIDREDWDLTWNMAVETGGVLVSKQIEIEIDAELLLVG
jgi:polyisoprenoid-binding protein YceI